MEETFDLAIIGGGINGAGIARDAARRGLKVVIIEESTWGGGTSSKSSMLAHGGLRYLEYAEIGLVHEALQDRERMFRDAAHLVTPLRFLYPLYPEIANKRTVRVGLMLYDWLSHGKSVPGRDFLKSSLVAKMEPDLNSANLKGAATFFDGQWYSVERHIIELLIDAKEQGAHLMSQTKVTAINTDERVAVDGLQHKFATRIQIRSGGKDSTILARSIVNAAGPWVDAVLDNLEGGEHPKLIRGTKGAHIAVPKFCNEALIVKTAQDGRTFFILPWRDFCILGTTDTDFAGDPRDAKASDEDVEYIQEVTKVYFPIAPVDDIKFTYAGVRPLVNQTGLKESAVTRKHVIVNHADLEGIFGLWSIQGGKLTTFRTLSEQVVDQVCVFLGRTDLAKLAPTRKLPLPGCPNVPLEEFLAETVPVAMQEGNLDAKQALNLVHAYGTRWRLALLKLNEGALGSVRTHDLWPPLDLDL